jgi:esterase
VDDFPIVFLHGVAGSRATYGWLPETIAGHAVVRPDFRGHGAAERTPGAYLIADYAADAVAVLRSVGPAVVVGHSLGGVAAWWAARLVPELVLGAFLEDPPLYMGEPAEHLLNTGIPHFRQLRSGVPTWQAKGISEQTAIELLAAQPFAPNPSLRVGEVLTEEAIAARAYALLHLDPAVLDPVVDGTLLAATDTSSPVTVPVTILAADDALGATFPTRHEERLAASHPAVKVVRLPGAGHSIHDERAHRAEYLERVTAFIVAVGRGG